MKITLKKSKPGMIIPLVQSINYFPILSQAQGNMALHIRLIDLLEQSNSNQVM